jgi:hypothetical protein
LSWTATACPFDFFPLISRLSAWHFFCFIDLPV